MKVQGKTCLKVGVSIFLLYLAIHYWPALAGFAASLLGAATPLVIGAMLAYMVNILMSFYERHYFPKSRKSAAGKSRRPVCMLAAFVTMIAIIALIIGLVVPELVACVQLIFAELPSALSWVAVHLEKLSFLPESVTEFLNSINWESGIKQLVELVTSGIGNVMGTVINLVSSVFSGVVTAFLSLIFAVYLLAGRDRISRQFGRLMDRYLPESLHRKISYTLKVLNDCFHRYIVGQCTEAVILGLLCTLGMLLLRLPYATMIGALVAFTALIPVAGAYIGAGVGAFMILTVSPIKALVFLVFLVILQQLEGNLIYPRVVGSSMGLPGVWVLAAVTVGGGLMGISGMLLGVPLTAAIYRMLREDVNRHSAPEPAEAPPDEA